MTVVAAARCALMHGTVSRVVGRYEKFILDADWNLSAGATISEHSLHDPWEGGASLHFADRRLSGPAHLPSKPDRP